MKKIRYLIDWQDLIIELDIFSGALTGLILAEVELPSETTPFTPPVWFGPEVSEDSQYSNIRLAEKTANTTILVALLEDGFSAVGAQ